MPNAIEQIYDQLMQVFGGTNPSQYFTLLMPASTLDQANYAYDTTGTKPALVAAAESLLVDNLYDVAKVTGSNNGERLSSQYMQALSVLLPQFDPAMPAMKNALRDFINSPAPADAKVVGQPFVGNLSEYYFALYSQWLNVKSTWDTEVQDKKNTLSSEKFLEWFEEHADGQLAQIDAAMGQLLAVFSPADMQAILGALEAGPGGELEQALATVQDIRLPSPNGGYAYPVDVTPDDWFLDLASDTDPADLLQDPQFIALTISAKRQAIMASISQVTAMIAQAPTTGQIKDDADSLAAAQSAYSAAQNNLLKTYAANTVTAVEMYVDAETGGALSVADDTLTELNTAAAAVSAAKGDVPPDTQAKMAGAAGRALNSDDVKQLLDGQKKLVDAQASLLSSSQKLADAGMNLSSAQAQTFGDLPVMLARLQTQLTDLDTLQSQVGASAAAAARRPTPSALLSSDTATAAQTVIQKIKTETATTAADMKTAVDNAVTSNNALTPIQTAADNAATNANATADDVRKAALDAAAKLSDSPTVQAAIKSIQAVTVVTTAVDMKTTVDDAVTINNALTPIQTAADNAATNTNATADSVRTAALAAAAPLSGSPTATKSLTSDRFMTLQFSFDSSTMQRTSSTDSQFNQTSWGVDLFFGSASGQSSDSSSSFSNQAFDSSTTIEIAFKAAKVDIQRGWFNPGMFKLSNDMYRLSHRKVSIGPVDFSSDNALSQANDTLLPSFPVAFVVAKDVSIRFQANSSSLQAVQSVLDSRSAAGGGFLCFSASSSSASHSDHSSLSSRTDGTVITINMPGPQVLGWFMEFTPADGSERLASGNEDGKMLDIIEFVQRLKRFSGKASISDATDEVGMSQVRLTTVSIPEDSTLNINLGNSKGLSITAGSCTATVHIDREQFNGDYVSAINPTSGLANPFNVKSGKTKDVLKTDLLAENVRVGTRGAAITVTY